MSSRLIAVSGFLKMSAVLGLAAVALTVQSSAISLIATVLAMVTVGLIVNAWAVDRKTMPAKAGAGRIVDLPGGGLQVREDGPATAPPVVLLHGWTASLGWWDRLVPLLEDHYRIVRFDLIGHGGSAKPLDGYSLDDQADRIARADPLVRSDPRPERHHRGAARFLQPLGQDGIGVDVGQHGEALGNEHLRRPQGFDGVGQ